MHFVYVAHLLLNEEDKSQDVSHKYDAQALKAK